MKLIVYLFTVPLCPACELNSQPYFNDIDSSLKGNQEQSSEGNCSESTTKRVILPMNDSEAVKCCCSTP